MPFPSFIFSFKSPLTESEKPDKKGKRGKKGKGTDSRDQVKNDDVTGFANFLIFTKVKTNH